MRKRLLILSADALVGEDLDYLKSCPNFQKYMCNASIVKKVKSIYPTVTYPAHTTMSTGCYPDKHGVVNNFVFSTNPSDDIWNWDSSVIMAEDIFTAAKKMGYSTAAVYWPVTGNHKDIDYLINEYWMTPEETLVSSMESQGSCKEVIDIACKNEAYLPGGYHKGGRLHVAVHPQFDDFGIQCACDIIRQYKPEVMLIHVANIDGARHKTGLFTPAVTREIRRTDDYIGELMHALEDADVLDETNFVLTSDHGQLNLAQGVKPNVKFVEAGLITLNEDKTLKDWQAYTHSTGMSAQVYLKNPENKAVYDKTYALLQSMAEEGIFGFEKVFTTAETEEAEHLSGGFSFVLESDGHSFFSDEYTGPVGCLKKLDDYRSGAASHGYLPHKGPWPVFLAKGPDFKENVVRKTASLADEAPTYAKLLGTELANADGDVLWDLLKQS